MLLNKIMQQTCIDSNCNNENRMLGSHCSSNCVKHWSNDRFEVY